MTPTLNKVILNGASRHRLDKGFIGMVPHAVIHNEIFVG